MPYDHFIETSTLIGLTFFSDRWYKEAQPLYNDRYRLHTSELVLYEYCNKDGEHRSPPENPEELNLDWDGEAGKYRDIEDRLKKPLPDFFRHTRRLGRNGSFTLEEGIDAFIQHFGIREEAEPQIRSEFKEHFEDRVVNSQYINEFVQDLIDRILKTAEENREKISEKIELHNSRYHIAEQTRRRWQELPEDIRINESRCEDETWRKYPTDHYLHEPDFSILVDATVVSKNGDADYLVTGDSDLLTAQETATEYYDLSIKSMSDKYPPTEGLPQMPDQ
jgi:hypothetical protein